MISHDQTYLVKNVLTYCLTDWKINDYNSNINIKYP